MMYKILVRFIIVSGIAITGFKGYAQKPTLGLLHYDEDVSDGYTLFTPERNNRVYLINNCGEKINEWSFSEEPGATCYLLENGTLLRAGKDSLEIRDWGNNLIWSYAMNANGINQHHDIEPLPNGNILCVVNDSYTDDEIIAEGRDSSNVDETFKLDKIVELQPVGTNDAEIVWEWKFFDHLIQDFDSTKSNFGVVKDHPELIDLNFDNERDKDYTHVNAIDYNSDLDQIIISARHLSELYIIDHSTTTSEAAGHSGGNSDMGGDILWRWGNPQVYRQGGVEDQQLFLPHDSKWVENGYQDEGKISVFNNGLVEPDALSSIHLIAPEISDGVYIKDNDKFIPLDFEWTWKGSILGNDVFENKKSGALSLPNGNFIICETSLGQASEINKDGDHLWTYRNPSGKTLHDQFEENLNSDNSLFRAEKYPSYYAGFFGQNLEPQGLIEDQNSISEECMGLIKVENLEYERLTIVNPIENGMIEFDRNITLNAITISDVNGKLVFSYGFFNDNNLEVDLAQGMYILQLYSDKKIESRKIIIR